MTAAALDDHVAVLLQDDVGALVKVEDRDSGQLGRCAARLRGQVRAHQVNQSL